MRCGQDRRCAGSECHRHRAHRNQSRKLEGSRNPGTVHSRCRRLPGGRDSSPVEPWVVDKGSGRLAGEWLAAKKASGLEEWAKTGGGRGGSLGALAGEVAGKKELHGENRPMVQTVRSAGGRCGVSSRKGQDRWRCSCGEAHQKTVRCYRERKCRQECRHAYVCCRPTLPRQSGAGHEESCRPSHVGVGVSSVVWWFG